MLITRIITINIKNAIITKHKKENNYKLETKIRDLSEIIKKNRQLRIKLIKKNVIIGSIIKNNSFLGKETLIF